MSETQRQLQKNKTRQSIIEAALIEFANNGLVATRTSDIANAANISHGAIFSHFKTKEILLEAVIEEFGLRVTKRLHDLISGTCGVKEVLTAHLKGINEHEAFYSRLILEGNLINESTRNSIVMIQSNISFHIMQAVESDIKEGKLVDTPLNLLFNTWLGLIHYYLTNKNLFSPEESVLKKYGDQLVEHFLRLIYKKEG